MWIRGLKRSWFICCSCSLQKKKFILAYRSEGQESLIAGTMAASSRHGDKRGKQRDCFVRCTQEPARARKQGKAMQSQGPPQVTLFLQKGKAPKTTPRPNWGSNVQILALWGTLIIQTTTYVEPRSLKSTKHEVRGDCLERRREGGGEQKRVKARWLWPSVSTKVS